MFKGSRQRNKVNFGFLSVIGRYGRNLGQEIRDLNLKLKQRKPLALSLCDYNPKCRNATLSLIVKTRFLRSFTY